MPYDDTVALYSIWYLKKNIGWQFARGKCSRGEFSKGHSPGKFIRGNSEGDSFPSFMFFLSNISRIGAHWNSGFYLRVLNCVFLILFNIQFKEGGYCPPTVTTFLTSLLQDLPNLLGHLSLFLKFHWENYEISIGWFSLALRVLVKTLRKV